MIERHMLIALAASAVLAAAAVPAAGRDFPRSALKSRRRGRSMAARTPWFFRFLFAGQ